MGEQVVDIPVIQSRKRWLQWLSTAREVRCSAGMLEELWRTDVTAVGTPFWGGHQAAIANCERAPAGSANMSPEVKCSYLLAWENRKCS